MKYLCIEVPYGKVLALPADAGTYLAEASIVDRQSYDWNNLTFSNEQIECRVVDESHIKPIVPVNFEPTPETPKEETPGVVPGPEVPF